MSPQNRRPVTADKPICQEKVKNKLNENREKTEGQIFLLISGQKYPLTSMQISAWNRTVTEYLKHLSHRDAAPRRDVLHKVTDCWRMRSPIIPVLWHMGLMSDTAKVILTTLRTVFFSSPTSKCAARSCKFFKWNTKSFPQLIKWEDLAPPLFWIQNLIFWLDVCLVAGDICCDVNVIMMFSICKLLNNYHLHKHSSYRFNIINRSAESQIL